MAEFWEGRGKNWPSQEKVSISLKHMFHMEFQPAVIHTSRSSYRSFTIRTSTVTAQLGEVNCWQSRKELRKKKGECSPVRIINNNNKKKRKKGKLSIKKEWGQRSKVQHCSYMCCKGAGKDGEYYKIFLAPRTTQKAERPAAAAAVIVYSQWLKSVSNNKARKRERENKFRSNRLTAADSARSLATI